MNLGHIAVGDLGAEKTGSDETNDGDDKQDPDELVARPSKRITFSEYLEPTAHSNKSESEEQRNKNA